MGTNSLPDSDISIVVVDDARFTCEIIRRVLVGAGYKDVRVANSATGALDMLKQRPASVLLADWLMPEMDGLTLTSRIRQLDEESNHYTYIVLLTAKEGLSSLTEAFDRGVDDFITKSPNNKELLARIRAAGRIAGLQNTLLKTTYQLSNMNQRMAEDNTFDPVTGAGNKGYCARQLERMLSHARTRGGDTCAAIIKLSQVADIRKNDGDQVADEIMQATAKRLQQTVRPLDVVCRVSDDEFAILMYQDDITQVHATTFKRIFQAINIRAFKTQKGYITVNAAVSVCGITNRDPEITPEDVLEEIRTQLKIAEEIGQVHLFYWDEVSEDE